MFTILTKGLNDLGNEFTMIEVKAMMKYKFAKCEVVSDDGEIIGERIKGTSEMSKLELSTFIDKVISYAADTFNIQIPYPNEEMMLNFN